LGTADHRNGQKKALAPRYPGISWHLRRRRLELEQLLQLLPVEANHHLLTPYDGDGCSHRSHPLQLGERFLVFSDVPDDGFYAPLTEELLRPVTEQSAGLREQDNVFLRHLASLLSQGKKNVESIIVLSNIYSRTSPT
jgi:hypothetical protein